MSIRRGMLVVGAALVGALPWMVPTAAHAQQSRGEQPMSVKLLPPSPETNQPLRFVLNQPGYVAAFIITPGEGVRLIYPLTNEEHVQWAGFHTEPLYGVHFDDDAYDVVVGRSAFSAASFGVGYASGPRYLYVVASRFPLDVSRFVHHPSELQRTIGYENARSFDTDYSMDALLNSAVSLGSDDSWDTDVYMLWAPTWMDYAPHSFQEALYWNLGTRAVVCRDGSIQVMPLNWIFTGCMGEGRLLLSRPVGTPAQMPARTGRLASSAESPTVLPTIRGIRMKAMPSAKNEPTPTGFLTTAAGGVTSNGVRLVDRRDDPQRQVTYTTVGGEPVVVDRSESLREREDGGHDGWRRARRERHDDDDTPRLAPAPRLAPDPVLAPPARMAPAPNVGYSRMNDAPEVQHAAPRPEAPRMEPHHMEAPRMSSPASSAPAVSAPRAVQAPPASAPQVNKVQ